MVRRSLAIATLGILVATVLAAPRSSAVEEPEIEVPNDGHGPADAADPSVLSMNATARLLGSQSETLLVGHGDVLRLYWAFFSRDPDGAGAANWIDQFDHGQSIDAIAFSFARSDEFRNTYGDTNDAQFVEVVYGNVLGRVPDRAGFEYWVDLLGSPAVTRTDVVRWVSASSEFINAHPYRRPSVAAQVDASSDLAVAVDVVEALAGQRPTSSLISDRSSELIAAVDKLQKRFGRFSAVVPTGACVRTGRTGSCPIRITEVGLSQDLTVAVSEGLVVGIESSESPEQWADDAVRTAVTGRMVYGSRPLSEADRKAVASNTRRIAPTVGGIGTATVSRGHCEDSTLPPRTPDGFDVARRGCMYSVTGDTYRVDIEAVSHDGRFAGMHVTVPLQYSETGFGPYAVIGDVTLHHPANRVERIGFHESGHDGARQQNPIDSGAVVFTMDSRSRGTGSRTAADIAVHPADEIRSPVTGTVLRAGTYTLYCEHSDHFLVIEPDSRPGYEVKVLHFEGLAVGKGDRVVAGKTLVGANVRKLPFDSQIDKTTSDPSSGHIHIEVVDPTIPDRPSGGGC